MALPSSYIREPMRVVESAVTGKGQYVWILDNHWDFTTKERTYLGQLLYQAKYQGDDASLQTLTTISKNAIRQIRQFGKNDGNFARINGVVAVPSTSGDSGRRISVPPRISAAVSTDLGIPDLSGNVLIRPGLRAAKLGAQRTPEDFIVQDLPANAYLLVVDDLFSTGDTMSAIATKLQSQGIQGCVGFALTKVTKGLAN